MKYCQPLSSPSYTLYYFFSVFTGVVCDWFGTYACDLLAPTGMSHFKILHITLTLIISLCRPPRFIFVMKTHCVLCEVGNKSVYVM
jgi:hypothetical protein